MFSITGRAEENFPNYEEEDTDDHDDDTDCHNVHDKVDKEVVVPVFLSKWHKVKQKVHLQWQCLIVYNLNPFILCVKYSPAP